MGFIRWTRGNVLGRALFLVMAGALVPACGGGGGGGGGGTPGLPTGLYITVTSLPSGTNGGVYTSTTLTAANGTAPYTFSLLSGSLPPGLTLTAGTISGTPTIDGSFSFKIRVTDAKNRVADQLFVITVTGGTASALVLSSTSPLPGATQNSAYLFALSATGGLQPYTWTVTAGSLPPGMSLNLNSGTLSGTPTGPTAGFTVTVTDSTSPVAQTASKAFTLAVNSPISVTALLAAATLNSAYSHTPTFSGGTAPFDWSLVSGTLPPGLTISAAGLISGTPTATGVFSFVLIVTDATGASVTTGMNIQVNTGITITTSSLPPDTINISYGSVPINASGGTLPYTTWAVTAGGLPPGISLNAGTGFLTGTPTGTGSFPVTITVTDSAGATASSTGLTIQINPVPVITSSSLPPDTQGINYNQQLTTTPGTGTGFLTFSLQGGSILPAGITLSPSGLLSGIPSAPYNSSFNVIVTDAVGAVSAPVNFPLVINGPPVVTNTAPQADTVNAVYPTYTPAMTGGTLPITGWSITTGALPAGLSIAPATGVISGTPTAAGSFSFTLTVTDAAGAKGSQLFTIVINAAPSISTTSLPGATQGTAYSQTLAVAGGTSPYTFAVVSGALPAGVTLNAATGVISGTPTGTGTATFGIQVTDKYSITSVTATLSIIVTGSTPSITTTTLPDGTNGSFYSVTLQATGGVAPYTWQQIAGSTLPTGVSLNLATGVLSGTPSTNGSFSLTVTATDSATPSGQVTAQVVLTFKISALTNSQGTLIITTSRLPDAAASLAYTNTLDVTGGTAPYTFTLDTTTGNQLPASLTLTTPSIHGTPALADVGLYTFGVTVTDSTATPLVAHANVKLFIGPPPTALSLTTSSLPSGQVGVAYTTTPLVAAGGQPPYSWTFTGGSVVPFGLILTKTGVLSGFPGQNGAFPVQITVTDNSSPPQTVTSSVMTLTIAQAASGFQITSTTLPAGAVGAAYSQPLTVNAVASQWVTNPQLLTDVGLALNTTTGVVSAPTTITASGVLHLTVAAVSNATTPTGALASVQLTIPPPAFGVTTTSLPDYVVGQAYNQTLLNQGGTGPFNWTVVSGSLPPGIALAAATGVLSGTPTGSGGNGSIVFRVTDSVPATATGLVSWAEAPTSASLTSTAAAPKSYDAALLPPSSLTRGTALAGFVMGVQNTNPDLTTSTLLTGQILPAGLAMDPLRRKITGTPTTPGRYLPRFLLGLLAENQTGSGPVLELSESQGLVEVIEPAAGFRVLTHTLPTGREGVAYPRIQILTAGVTTGGLTFSLSGTSGPLPPGITLDPQGFLSGTPTEAGTFPIVVQIVNTATIFAAYDLIIDPGLPFGILRGTLSTGVVGVPYHETLDAYGPAATAWSDAGSATTFASLGLSLASGTGVVSGTPTAAPNAYVVVVTATATGHTSVRAVSIQIAQTAVTAQYFATPGVVGATYSDTIQAFGGTPPYAFALVPGESLPPGLALGGAGALSGTPTATTPFGGPLVAITDSTPVTPRTGFGQLLLIVLDPLAPALGLPSSVDSISGTVGTAMTFTPAPYGGTTPYTLAHETTSPPAVTADGLPPGLTLGAGSITGTPTASGLYPFTLKVTDNSTPNKVIDAQLLFEIQPSGTPGVLGIETMQIPNGVHTANYPATQLLLVTNGVAGPFAWSLTGAPGTLTVAAGTGVVSSSSPLAAGTYYFNVTATKAPATATGRVKVVIQ